MTTPLFIGLDLGGTEVKVGLCGSAGEVVWSHRRPSHAHLGQEAILQALGEAVDGALAEAQSGGHHVNAIGLGTPGIVDPDSGVIRFPVANLGGWHGTDIVGFFRDRYQMPAVVENDASAAAWGEYSSGAGKGARILLAATVGTGIGGGAIIDGEILRGAIGGAKQYRCRIWHRKHVDVVQLVNCAMGKSSLNARFDSVNKYFQRSLNSCTECRLPKTCLNQQPMRFAYRQKNAGHGHGAIEVARN